MLMLRTGVLESEAAESLDHENEEVVEPPKRRRTATRITGTERFLTSALVTFVVAFVAEVVSLKDAFQHTQLETIHQHIDAAPHTATW